MLNFFFTHLQIQLCPSYALKQFPSVYFCSIFFVVINNVFIFFFCKVSLSLIIFSYSLFTFLYNFLSRLFVFICVYPHLMKYKNTKYGNKEQQRRKQEKCVYSANSIIRTASDNKSHQQNFYIKVSVRKQKKHPHTVEMLLYRPQRSGISVKKYFYSSVRFIIRVLNQT